MKKVTFLLTVLLVGCQTIPGRGGPLLRQPQVPGSSCLSQEVIDQRLAVLEDIPKPVDAITSGETDPATGQPTCNQDTDCNIDPDGTENPGWVNCTAEPNRGCLDHPDKADYILVASQIKIPEIILDYPQKQPPTDRQLIKQFSNTKRPLKPGYENKIYRPFCGDWCYPGSGAAGFRGTFYCDFVFFLTSEYDPDDPDKHHPASKNLPPDGSIFDVYIREGAPIPDKVKCQANATPAAVWQDLFTDLFDVKAQANQPIIRFEGASWIYVGYDQTVKAKDLTSFRLKRGEVDFENIPYWVYQDLVARFGPDIIYLTKPDEVEEAYTNYRNNPLNPVYAGRKITYKEFHKSTETKPESRGLQLGTFQVPIAATWVKDWVYESKPAIYLYGPVNLTVSLKLEPKGNLTTSLPTYPFPSGWLLTTDPGGKISYQGQVYPYLYYESEVVGYEKPSSGFVVSWAEIDSFLKTKLPILGLRGREIDDFLNYWLPRLKSSAKPYLFISFIDQAKINAVDPLKIAPQPQTTVRVRAYFKFLDQPINVPPQDFLPLVPRTGLTVVEWGGILNE